MVVNSSGRAGHPRPRSLCLCMSWLAGTCWPRQDGKGGSRWVDPQNDEVPFGFPLNQGEKGALEKDTHRDPPIRGVEGTLVVEVGLKQYQNTRRQLWSPNPYFETRLSTALTIWSATTACACQALLLAALCQGLRVWCVCVWCRCWRHIGMRNQSQTFCACRRFYFPLFSFQPAKIVEALAAGPDG